MLHDHDYHPLAIAEIRDETHDTRSFVLEVPSELEEIFRYVAGQFCTFRATIDGAEVVRCYSMSSSPVTGDPLTVTVKRVAGGLMSNWMNDELAIGDTLDVMRPAGLFVLRDSHEPIVAFAGGSGITPVTSIIKTALAVTNREVGLVYANRDADSVIFADEFDRLQAESGGRLWVHHHLDADDGLLDGEACAGLAANHAGADFYVCGPGPFMDVVEDGLARLAVPADGVFIERFVLDEALDPVEASVTEEVVVRIAGRRHRLEYRSGETLLQTARRGGLAPPSSCEGGSCATCLALVEAGAAGMRVNNALDPIEVEEGWTLTCQALPTTPSVTVNYDA